MCKYACASEPARHTDLEKNWIVSLLLTSDKKKFLLFMLHMLTIHYFQLVHISCPVVIRCVCHFVFMRLITHSFIFTTCTTFSIPVLFLIFRLWKMNFGKSEVLFQNIFFIFYFLLDLVCYLIIFFMRECRYHGTTLNSKTNSGILTFALNKKVTTSIFEDIVGTWIFL